MPLQDPSRTRILDRLQRLYDPSQASTLLARLDELADRYPALRSRPNQQLWDQRTGILITYGDQVQQEGRPSLEVLREFLTRHDLDQTISGVHLLPFFPYSSDDGFSVIDYRQVNPPLGDWTHVAQLGETFELMIDLVVNHCSQQNTWFQEYLAAEPPYDGYFIDTDPAIDLSAVTRPRSSPLLTAFETSQGTRHVWTTFSADQVDLNFSNPAVLLEMLDVLLGYVQQGARIVRLDAIGFLWKTIGTDCMHLPHTHEVVKLMRDLLDDVAPGTVLITETNVPHAENVSYFGDGDEAHAVYQFSLAPLLLDALLTGDARPIKQWLEQLEQPGPGRTFFNFTASHDGIGVRPLEGLVSDERLAALVQQVQRGGGRVNMRRNSDGTDSPYELNVTYFSALGDPADPTYDSHAHASRFLASQAVMLALRGIPGIYFHSLVGTPNYEQGVAETGQNRTINRRKFELNELETILADRDSAQFQVFDGYQRMLAVRIAQPAFHPDAEQRYIPTDDPALIAWLRQSLDGNQQILVLVNVGNQPLHVDPAALAPGSWQRDLISDRAVAVASQGIKLPPGQVLWLGNPSENTG